MHVQTRWRRLSHSECAMDRCVSLVSFVRLSCVYAAIGVRMKWALFFRRRCGVSRTLLDRKDHAVAARQRLLRRLRAIGM